MNQEEHIEKTIKRLNDLIESLYKKYDIIKKLTFERCLSTSNIENIILSDEKSIYDQLDSIHKKNLKNIFKDLKKINLLGNPKLYYYKDNTIKINSTIIDTLWFDGSRDNINFILKKYLEELEKYLRKLPFIKYLQYALDIPGLNLEGGKEKITIEECGLTITFPFVVEDVNFFIELIKPELNNKKMEIMSLVLLLRETNNEIYIPEKYSDYYLPEIFLSCLKDFYINSIYQSKYIKVYFEGRFIDVLYPSSYEFMNNKTNKPYCYFYINNHKLLSREIENKINKILKLQDDLE